MRTHGVANYPDQGEITTGSGIDPNSPSFQAAQQACRKYLPSGSQSPAQNAQAQAAALAYSKCMRSHGVINFPDLNPNGVQAQNPLQGIDTHSATYQAAQQACQSLMPGNGGSGG